MVLLLTFAFCARVWLFSGIGLGDDMTYAHVVHQIITTGYPEPADPIVFLLRPAFLYPVATSVRWFGWTDFGFVLPVLAASLIGIASTYLLGAALSGRTAAILSALTLSLAPLDLVNSTTLTNDICGSAYLGVGAVFGIAAFRKRSHRQLLFAVLGGFIFGLSTLVKISFVVAVAPLAICVTHEIWRKRHTWKIGAAMLAGYASALFLLALFCLLKFGDGLAPLSELEFNYGAMEREYSPDQLTATLLYYPRMIAGLRPAGPYGHEIFPFGWFFLLAIMSTCAVPFLNIRSAWRPGVFFLFLLLVMEFWPLELQPYYAPIHRLPRFLHIAAIPGALMIGICLSEMLKRKFEWKVVAVATLAIYAVTSLRVSSAASDHHNDCMRDVRLVAEHLRWSEGLIVSDTEMRSYLVFADEFRAPNRFLMNPATAVPSGSLVALKIRNFRPTGRYEPRSWPWFAMAFRAHTGQLDGSCEFSGQRDTVAFDPGTYLCRRGVCW